MAKSIIYIGIVLVVLSVADGQSTTSEDSHCSYMFKVPASECSQTTGEDQLMKGLMIALQTQVKLLYSRQEELTDENVKLRQKIEAGKTEKNAVTLFKNECSLNSNDLFIKFHCIYITNSLCSPIKPPEYSAC